MMLHRIWVVAAFACSLGAKSLKEVKHVYVDRLQGDLDQYIRAEVVKQKQRFDIVGMRRKPMRS